MTPRRPIRLVHCLGRLQTGGRELQLAALAERLPRERFEQQLVLLQETGDEALANRFRAAGCVVVELGWKMNRRLFDPRWRLEAEAVEIHFADILRGFGAEIVHGWLGWSNLMSVWAGRRSNTRVIVTSRVRLPMPGERHPVMSVMQNRANAHTRAIFVNAEALRRDVEKKERHAAGKCHVIYNGVDPLRFIDTSRDAARAALGLAPGDCALLFVANLHPYKGHDVLLRAMARMTPGAQRVVLLLAGGDKGRLASLEALAAKLKLGSRVRFLGRRDDIPELLAACDIYVHPSRSEGFSNAVLEAMAAGRPPVVSAAAGLPEAVIDGESGLVVKSGDSNALAGALSRLAGDPKLASRLGVAARIRAETEFDFDAIAGRFADWYESLIPARR